jgi:hypothetical protein
MKNLRLIQYTRLQTTIRPWLHVMKSLRIITMFSTVKTFLITLKHRDIIRKKLNQDLKLNFMMLLLNLRECNKLSIKEAKYLSILKICSIKLSMITQVSKLAECRVVWLKTQELAKNMKFHPFKMFLAIHSCTVLTWSTIASKTHS